MTCKAKLAEFWCLSIIAAGTALAGWGYAATVENDFLLQTKNTTMAFHKSGDTWLMVHYGAKIEKSGDANALA